MSVRHRPPPVRSDKLAGKRRRESEPSEKRGGMKLESIQRPLQTGPSRIRRMQISSQDVSLIVICSDCGIFDFGLPLRAGSLFFYLHLILSQIFLEA